MENQPNHIALVIYSCPVHRSHLVAYAYVYFFLIHHVHTVSCLRFIPGSILLYFVCHADAAGYTVLPCNPSPAL